ncbi:MAG: transposase [Candidatus Magnetoglobus multicellularis str. Araruama]|uniref:Transposase n=1 Tax=Candidatus Magnetoglobus multicellularis str. Araruama TaxID=890399 RepID=A0A1V1NZS2_9BACT|nr:MAG: transposase [Candidatus Magnetoglobus multicellularis str. Araruama]
MNVDNPEIITIQPKFTVADIFNRFMDDYLKNHSVPYHYEKVINDIQNCGTGYFGYTLLECDNCGEIEITNNSCGNRHCPSCQGGKQRIWVQQQIDNLLPVLNYHVVFTIPAMLNDLCMYNEQLLYELLFKASAETLKQFGRDEKWLGAELGFFGILHTWGQTNWIHPHIHYLVPGGGLDGDKWKDVKYGGKFLFPVRALSIVFRGKFIQGLKKLYYKSKLTIPESMNIQNSKDFESFLDVLVARNWIAYSKAPFKTPEAVVKYIGYYSHRVALSNNRIKSIDNKHVVISYKDYKDNKKEKDLKLTGEDFIDRFLFHILPANFHKLRYFGIFANGNTEKREKAVQALKEAGRYKPEKKEQNETKPKKMYKNV